MAYIFGQQQIERFFIETRKDTDKVILINNTLFKKLKDVDTVFVLGHSLNDIDLPYFKKISKSLKKYVEWHVSYFDEKDKYKIMNVFSTLNIKFKLIKISDVFQ